MPELKAYYEAKRFARRGVIGSVDIPAGWALCWVESGQRAEGQTVRYATEAEAEARIPAILASRDAAAALAEAREAVRLAEESAAATEAAQRATLATEEQVSYLTKLIVRAARWSDVEVTDRYMVDGVVDLSILRAMDRRVASALIDHLREQH